MCFEVLEGPFLPQKGVFVTLQVRGSFKFKYRDFSTSVICLDCFEDLSRKFGLETRGNFPWVHHLRKFILARGSFSSWLGSLHVYFPVLGYCSLSSGPWNSASMDLRLVLCSGTLGRILFFMPWGGASVHGNLLTNLVVLWSCGCGFSSLWIRESWSGVQIQLLLKTSVPRSRPWLSGIELDADQIFWGISDST